MLVLFPADNFFTIAIIQTVVSLTFSDRGTNARRQTHTWCFQPVECKAPSTVPILAAAILLADVIKHMYVVPARSLLV